MHLTRVNGCGKAQSFNTQSIDIHKICYARRLYQRLSYPKARESRLVQDKEQASTSPPLLQSPKYELPVPTALVFVLAPLTPPTLAKF